MAINKLSDLWPFRKPSSQQNFVKVDERVNEGQGEKVPPTSTRRSKPTIESSYTEITNNVKFVNPGFIRTIIPVIRKLSWINPDVGLALNDLTRLTNTGHRIKFDQNIPEAKRDTMRRHLHEVRKSWGDGTNGINGIVNKIVAQIWISGALSCEWVINSKLNGISNIALVNPETIEFSLNKSKQRFEPYQRQNFKTGGIIGHKLVKLNPLTYQYIAINGDTEIPYGIPPFLTAINGLDIQKNMDKNIDYIIEQLGLLGFFETLVEKPPMKDGENDDTYQARLVKYLNEVKAAVKDGMKDGTVVGYKDDHDFEFHSPTKDITGASELYNQNEVKIAKGLKIPSEFLGVNSNSSESAMGIIFTKMLSQLVNVQESIKSVLEVGYSLELLLAGFGNIQLEVEFKPSTITDELKYQQALEYKIRNIENKYNMGVIGQQQKAEELGYDKPDKPEPRAPITDSAGKNKKLDDKNKSERGTADKKKTSPKRKDSNTKPV